MKARPVFRLDVFRCVNPRCAIARVSLEGETWVRCLALLGAEALRINRSLYGQCRAARAIFTRAEARRARSPWPFGRSGVELRFRVGAVPAVTPVLFDQRLQPTIRLIKNGHSPCLGPLRAASHAGGSPRIHAERLVEAVSVPWRRRFFLIRVSSVPRALRHRSLVYNTQRALHAMHSVHCPETPGPRRNDVRRRRPGPHDVTSSLARPQVETRRSRQGPPEPRERYRARTARSVFPSSTRSSQSRRPALSAGGYPRGRCPADDPPVSRRGSTVSTNSGSTTQRAQNLDAFAV